jgi:hypothetical protein
VVLVPQDRSIDLDDDVMVNYGKFDDLLAEVQASAGRKSNESRKTKKRRT